MNSPSTGTHPAAQRFAEFGETETTPLSKLQKLTGAYLTRNWSRIPHVTHNDDADVSALEAARLSLAGKYSDRRITALAFHVKAVVAALKRFPKFNSSLDDNAEFLVIKKFYNIGIAVDTPKGLVVPVIRNADRKNIPDIALELETVAAKAQAKGLSMQEMSGGCFTISSLGRNGGTSFTPIINSPEVAILGTSRLQDRPFRDGNGIAWKKVLPLSLSYDHRVINGAEAAAFVTALVDLLANPHSDWTMIGADSGD
jgi:pyruvate dehydrogenase E2 component (dihydrolipoamide acetyltransferase)